jgi:ADP-dependent NAD(P)H-hydrate dehydratase / NAD(P)H-hydrate epimerase
MKILSCDQIRELDAYTIQHEPVSSADLMERAATQVFAWLSGRFDRTDHFIIFAGPGNNGGDGLALARMLAEKKYLTDVYYVRFSDRTSDDWNINRERLKNVSNVTFSTIENNSQLPTVPRGSIIIDAILGSGLARPAEGLAATVIRHINLCEAVRIAVDIPSGLFCENNDHIEQSPIVEADYTLTFQLPKLAFMFAGNEKYVGRWSVLPIGLDVPWMMSMETPYNLISNEDIVPLLRIRRKFDHKGVYGHGLLISGSYGKMGAAVIGSMAALKSGAGLITCHVPSCGYAIMQTAVPEAMVITDQSFNSISGIVNPDSFTAVGAGPGIGTSPETAAALKKFLIDCRKPVVLDADALNILSLNRGWLSLLNERTIITPHLKEFERIAGKTHGCYARLCRQREFAAEYKCIVVLKGAYSSIALPDGRVFFNSTGNPGMAKGGSGDALTGIILSLLSQGYIPENAAKLGVYVHGLAGDISLEESAVESIVATDIINCIGKAFNRIREKRSYENILTLNFINMKISLVKAVIMLSLVLTASCYTGKKAATSDISVSKLGNTPVSDRSIIYGLPRTVFTIVAEMERTIEIPGPYYRYAGDLLGLDDVIREESEHWTIKSISVRTHEELDPSEFYVIEGSSVLQSNVLAMRNEGLVMDINPGYYYSAGNKTAEAGPGVNEFIAEDLGSDEYFQVQRDTAFRRMNIDSTFIRIPYVVEKKRKLSDEQLAERAARRLMEMREGKHMILTGESNVFPQSEAVIKEMNRIERDYIELFTGKSRTERRRFTYQIVPSKEATGKPFKLFGFSELTGPVNEGGIPVMMEFVPERRTKQLNVIKKVREDDKEAPRNDMLYYRVPDIVNMKISMETEVLFNSRRMVYQLGEIVRLPANYVPGQ